MSCLREKLQYLFKVLHHLRLPTHGRLSYRTFVLSSPRHGEGTPQGQLSSYTLFLATKERNEIGSTTQRLRRTISPPRRHGPHHKLTPINPALIYRH